ncbi:hypothetical protein QO010_003354 [Caulobacter ginsengisoli]|uniref:Uncharacterized protein n=1 Tax=Caulobacter ginsengisoli TaxID=400775 RepID=A0ABU0IU79_9CAUL|nr:hypothetical protein [Caulobacter ginsengisoli]MDQ0465565.1 hypothetical protein [Caulobacter ginsengisoli]
MTVYKETGKILEPVPEKQKIEWGGIVVVLVIVLIVASQCS